MLTLLLALSITFTKPPHLDRKLVIPPPPVKVANAKKFKWYMEENGKAVKCSGKESVMIVIWRKPYELRRVVDGCPFPYFIRILKD
jgi:hypothetical protein